MADREHAGVVWERPNKQAFPPYCIYILAGNSFWRASEYAAERSMALRNWYWLETPFDGVTEYMEVE